MKNVALLCVMFLQPIILIAQEAKKDSNFCKCQYQIQVKYPEIAEENKLNGTVIVEYEIDSLCISGNPKIVQSLGPDYDKEALRVVNLMISFQNNCNLKCKSYWCNKRKVRFPLTFTNAGND